MSDESEELFRREAWRHHAAGAGVLGDPLKLLPGWIRWSYRALALVIVLCAILGFTFRLTRFGSGQSVVQIIGQRDIVSPATALVDSILVMPGQTVTIGQPLVRLDASEQEAELGRVRQEFDLALANHLRDLLDPSANEALSRLRTQLEFATRTRDMRDLRSPVEGRVGDLRCQSGQQLLPGQSALTLLTKHRSVRFVGALPGRFRPLLRTGLPAWFASDADPHRRVRVVIVRVDEEIIGPNEAGRYLGNGVADAVTLSGPVVMVEAALVVRDNGRMVDPDLFYSGAHGRLDVELRSEPAMLALIPGLATAVGNGHD